MDRKITVTVPVVIKGEPRGVKVEGGVLDFVHREIELETLPARDSGRDRDRRHATSGLNDAVYVRDVAANATWTPVSDLDMMLVHVITPRAVEEPVAADAAAVAAPVAARPSPKSSRRARPTRKATRRPAKDKKDKK